MAESGSGPEALYRQYQADGQLLPDVAQAAAVGALQDVYAAYTVRLLHESRRWTQLMHLIGWRDRESVRGLYLWGSVGRGKTYMMDLLYRSIPGDRKLRMHFHRFMLMVHRRLHQEKGYSNPLVRVAARIAKDADLLCFDEFFVSDIGDAMLLGNLLTALFDKGVTLVATSNIEPDRLYENGLQRAQFLPAIRLLKQHCSVLNLAGPIDYRLRSLDRVPVYLQPLGAASEAALAALFGDLTRGLQVETGKVLDINERPIPTRAWSEGQVWFDFETLCGGPRSAADYIEIARQYHTVVVSGVPVLRENADDKARRFVTLVDEFYDHGVKLVVSAAAPLEDLYLGTDLLLPFSRARSRLQEMQTREYLGGPHRPD
jgi:cell division protein ZapE